MLRMKIILLLASLLYKLRPLSLYPGWYFSIADSKKDFFTKIKFKIWRYFRAKKDKPEILLNWYDSKLLIRMGTDFSRMIFIGGTAEPNELFYIYNTIKPGMTFVDIGANCGYYSLLAASLVGCTGKVLSFEPSTKEYDLLKKNIKLNNYNQICTYKCALSDKNEESLLAIADSVHPGFNTLGEVIANSNVKIEKLEKVIVRTLDDVLLENSINNLDFIKIDVEGFEEKVIKGAELTIKKFFPILQIELNQTAYSLQSSSAIKLLSLLSKWGYIFFKFGSKGFIEEFYLDSSTNSMDGNIIAKHK